MKMEYIYAAMLLHKAGKDINEENVRKVIEAAGVQVDEARVKALVTALQGVDIGEAIKKAAAAPVAVAAVPAAGEAPKEEKKEEAKKEDDKKTEEAAAAGLGALFG
jgi:large subunit ribosomal protein L12